MFAWTLGHPVLSVNIKIDVDSSGATQYNLTYNVFTWVNTEMLSAA